MGCSVISRSSDRKISTRLKGKPSLSFMKSDSFASIQTNNMSRLSSALAPVCLKIDIIKDCNKIEYSSLNLSGTPLYIDSFEYVSDFNYVKQTYSSYMSSFRYFCSLVHTICLENFAITDGVFIMLASIMANSNAKIKFTKNLPYFEVIGDIHEESDKIVQSWIKLTQEIDKILAKDGKKLKKCKRRLKNFIDLLQRSTDYCIRQDRIEKTLNLAMLAVKTAQELLKSSLQMCNQVEKFVTDRKKNVDDLRKLAKRAGDIDLYSGERIVHVLLKP